MPCVLVKGEEKTEAKRLYVDEVCQGCCTEGAKEVCLHLLVFVFVLPIVRGKLFFKKLFSNKQIYFTWKNQSILQYYDKKHVLQPLFGSIEGESNLTSCLVR